MEKTPDLLPDSSIVAMGEVIEVAKKDVSIDTRTLVSGNSQSPDQDQNDNDAHDQKATLNIQSMLTHDPRDGLSNTNCSFTNDDDGK